MDGKIGTGWEFFKWFIGRYDKQPSVCDIAEFKEQLHQFQEIVMAKFGPGSLITAKHITFGTINASQISHGPICYGPQQCTHETWRPIRTTADS
jgi:hypothetical protein